MSTAVCELACAEAAHHQSHAAATGCHEQGPAAGVVALAGAAAAPCHGQDEGSTAILEAAKLLMPAGFALVELPTSLGGDARQTSQGGTRSRPADRLLIRTQLRI
ncbi:MAG TPA: hypothetical protein VIX63_08460 [Vicinamibacterales bacterium]